MKTISLRLSTLFKRKRN